MSTNRPIVFLIGLGVSLTLLGAAGWQWHKANVQTKIAQEQTKKAEAQTRIAESRRLAASSDEVRPERLDLAMLLALEASNEGDTLEARRSLQRALDARPEVVRFLHVPEGNVNSVAFGPDGKIAAGYGTVGVGGGGGVVLFDARGERLRPAPLEVKEGAVWSVAFGPDGKIAAGYGGGVVLFDARGERLRPAPLEVKEGAVWSVAFGPDGKIAAGYDTGGVGGGVVLFDARGERLRPAPLEVKEGKVRSVAFGPEGKIAVGYARVVGTDPTVRIGPSAVRVVASGVVLFDARGERLRPAPLEVKEAQSGAWPSGRTARSPRDMASVAATSSAAWCSSTPGASGSDPRRWRSRRAMSIAWPSGRTARSPRDMAAAAWAAAWCSSTPGASGSDPRRWRSRRRSRERGLRAGRQDRRGIWRRRGALRRLGRASPTRAAGGQGGRCQERGLRAGRQDRRGIWL